MAANRRGEKFVIQPFRHNSQMNEEFAEQTWDTLHRAIHEINKQNASVLSFEELYRNAYNMVLHKFGDKLYNGLVETLSIHLRSVTDEVQRVNDEEFLQRLKEKWDEHRLSSIMIRDILMYMDRTYVVAQKKTPVYERGLLIFRDEVCRCPRIKDRLLNMLLDLIQREVRFARCFPLCQSAFTVSAHAHVWHQLSSWADHTSSCRCVHCSPCAAHW